MRDFFWLAGFPIRLSVFLIGMMLLAIIAFFDYDMVKDVPREWWNNMVLVKTESE